MDPIQAINDDRHLARSHDDASADLCFLALSDKGQPSVRTLVLREVSDTGLTLFINTTSPKWQIIQDNPAAELLLWYHSIQRQYRVTGRIEQLDRSVIEKNWPRRPAGSKYLDHSYGTLADQSSVLANRQSLIDHVTRLRESRPEDSLTTPTSATGVILIPDIIECLDLNRADRIHERKQYTRQLDSWMTEHLMP